MTVRVGINGFGRIGRNFFRAVKERGADIDIVAVNDLGSLDTMAHLLKYDSVLGVLPQTIKASKGGITVDGDELLVLSERDPKNLPWGDLGGTTLQLTDLLTGDRYERDGDTLSADGLYVALVGASAHLFTLQRA